MGKIRSASWDTTRKLIGPKCEAVGALMALISEGLREPEQNRDPYLSCPAIFTFIAHDSCIVGENYVRIVRVLR